MIRNFIRGVASLALAAGLFFNSTAEASVALPAEGTASYWLNWTALGPLTDIRDGSNFGSSLGANEFSLVVAGPTTFKVELEDCCIPGDIFGFVLGGVATAWTSLGFTSGFFIGIYEAMLAAGTYSFSFTIDEAPGGFDAAAFVTFTTEGAEPSAIPLPAGAPLLLAGIGGLLLLRRRRQV